MAKRKISELFDEQAIKQQIDNLKGASFGFLDELEGKLKGMAGNKVQIGSASNFKQLNTAQQEYNAYIKDTDSIKKALLLTEKKLQESQSTYTKIIAANKLELKNTNDLLKAQVAYENAATGSREKAAAGIKYFNLQKKTLNEYNEVEKKQLDSLNEKVNRYEAQLKRTGSNIEKLKANVGNYAGDLAKPFESLQRVLERLKNQQAGTTAVPFVTGDPSSQAAGGSGGPNRQLLDDLDKVFVKASRSGATATQQVKQLENAFVKLSQAADPADKEMQKFLKEFKAEVGAAKDAVADLKDEIKLAASDTRGIDNVVGSLNALAGIAQGAAGAYALFGGSEEDAAKVTAKLIAIQGIANSVQQVGQELTRKGTLANKAYEYVLNLVTVATNSSATASARLNAVLKLSTIGVIVGLIAAFIYGLTKAAAAVKEVSEEQARLNSVISETKDSYVKANLEVNNLKIAFEQAKTGIISKGEALKLYNDTIGKTTGQVKTLDEAEKALAKNADAYIQFTLLKAAANIALQKAAEKAFDAQFKAQNPEKADLTDQLFNSVTKNPLSLFGKLTPSQAEIDANIKDAKAKNKKQVDELTKENKALLDIAQDFQKKAEDLGKKYKFDYNGITEPKPAAVDKPKKVEDKTAQDILKANYELARQELEIIANKEKAIFDDEKQSFSDRLDALKQFTATQMELIKIEQQFEKDQEELRLKEVIKGLEDQKKVKGANIKGINDQEEKERKASDLRLQVIEGKGFAARIKATEDFGKSLESLKDGRQKIRDDEKQQILDYEAWTLAQIKKATDAVAAAEKEAADKKKASDDKSRADLRSATIKASEELQATVLFFLTSSIDKENAALDAKQKRLDDDTARRINQVNLLGLTEQERIKKTAEIEKQAMFETEQIEKRKRKLAVERAKFEKLANIASIISSTAQAVVGALGSKPWTPLNIALAAVVGGLGVLQLARAVAAPIPQYRKGTDSAKPGLSLVSEEGSELMERNGRMYLTPAQPTLMEMVGGEKITPAHLTRDILNSIMFSKNMQSNGLVLLQPSGMSGQQADTMITELKELKKETARNRFRIHWHSDNGWNAYVEKNIR